MMEQGDLFSGMPDRPRKTTGAMLRNQGIAMTLEHEREIWRRSYWNLCERWFQKQPVGLRFSGEYMNRAMKPFLGDPHHPNVWGAVSSRMLRAWLKTFRIEVDGVTRAVNLKNHAHLYRAYRKVAI